MSREIKDFERFFEYNRIPIRLASQTSSGWPVVISLWFLYRDGELYCATQKNARIVSYLTAENRCGYEIASDLPPYCGVRGQARARIDPTLGPQILEDLIEKYIGNNNNSLASKLLANSENEVAIILKPVNAFPWDFSSRMAQIAPEMIKLIEKTCP
jgi:hypothetical protein